MYPLAELEHCVCGEGGMGFRVVNFLAVFWEGMCISQKVEISLAVFQTNVVSSFCGHTQFMDISGFIYSALPTPSSLRVC